MLVTRIYLGTDEIATHYACEACPQKSIIELVGPPQNDEKAEDFRAEICQAPLRNGPGWENTPDIVWCEVCGKAENRSL